MDENVPPVEYIVLWQYGYIPCLFQANTRIEVSPNITKDEIVSDYPSYMTHRSVDSSYWIIRIYSMAAGRPQAKTNSPSAINDLVSFDHRAPRSFPEKNHVRRKSAVGAVYIFKKIVPYFPTLNRKGIQTTRIATGDHWIDLVPPRIGPAQSGSMPGCQNQDSLVW